MKKLLTSATLYTAITLLILGWWWLAFIHQAPERNLTHFTGNHLSPGHAPPSFMETCISPIKREILHEALSGDFSLMAKLMADWDLDAQIMEAHGMIGVKRLSRYNYTKAQMLGRLLKKSNTAQLAVIGRSVSDIKICDDLGIAFNTNSGFKRFLPQTYVAASFLMAIASPEQIVALPQGLRNHTQLYPKRITNQIPIDSDCRIAEQLHLIQPEIAFVSHVYSHPATLQALQNQGIKLFALKSIDTVSDITSALTRIGGVIDRTMEAELLVFFIDAAMLAIDNRMLIQHVAFASREQHPKFLFLNYYTRFSLPGSKTLTGQLLDRLGIHQPGFRKTNAARCFWTIPIEQEEIANYNPDCIVILSPNGKSLRNIIEADQAMCEVSAIRNNKVYFLDEHIQQSPTQYIVLAYYDIYQAIAGQGCP